MYVYQTPGIYIYTDGSCHTQLKIGTWVAIILVDTQKTVLSGIETQTTQNQMELNAVIEAIHYITGLPNDFRNITVVSDSQYVIGLPARKLKLESANLKTKHGYEIKNAPRVKQMFEYIDAYDIIFQKIKAHQKKTDIINYNIEADFLSRSLLRKAVHVLKP